MDDSQVGKWQALVSCGGLPGETGGAGVRNEVSTLRSLGPIEPDGRESPNGVPGSEEGWPQRHRGHREDRGQWTVIM